jgi:pilus assembly protein Flp/PilA
MKNIKQLFIKSEVRGAALVEYGILVGLIAVAAITSVVSLGNRINSSFESTTSALAATQKSTAAAAETAPQLPGTNIVGWTIVTGNHPWDTNRVGYDPNRRGDLANSYGLLTQHTSDTAYTMVSQSFLYGTDMWVSFDGNVQLDLQDHLLYCEGELIGRLRDAPGFSHVPSEPSSTSWRFNSIERIHVPNSDGEEFSCSLRTAP